MPDFTLRRGDTWTFDLLLRRPHAQDVIIEGAPTGGTWTATVRTQDGQALTTYPIPYNATAEAVETALVTLANVEPDDVAVTGGPGPGTPWTITNATDAAYLMAVAGSFSGGAGVSIRVVAAPFDLTGGTVYVTFKRADQAANLADDAEGVYQYHWIDGGTSDGIAVADPTTGRMTVTVEDTESATYQTVKYAYDVQVTDGAGRTFTPDTGALTVTPDITRATP
jgi:hypothetical protein